MGNRSFSKKPDIICFGDSLTVGYQSPTPNHPVYRETPYGNFLQDQMGSNYYIMISGLNGELAAEMVHRFKKDVLERSPRYVVILGGTNDLGLNRCPSEIFRDLATMYDQAEAVSIIPIAITVPSLRPLQFIGFSEAREIQYSENPEWQLIRSQIEQRLELNGKIRNYCTSRDIPCVDLFAETAEPESKLLALSYSNDGLHFSTQGYKLLAQLLWKYVFQGREGDKVKV